MKQGIDFIGVAVGAMILNEQGRVLLCKRSRNAKNERGCWEAPGGAVDYGETLEAAIRREMREELGIEIDILEQFPAKNHILPDEHQHWVPTCFLVRIKDGAEPRIMEPHKCDEIGWFDLDDLPHPLSVITTLDLDHYRSRILE